jgi:protein associated with RNAse G/E
MPPVFENGVLDYIDLDLDVLVWKDFTYKILDREDFKESAEKYGYSKELRNRVEKSLKEITRLISTRSFPFD